MKLVKIVSNKFKFKRKIHIEDELFIWVYSFWKKSYILYKDNLYSINDKITYIQNIDSILEVGKTWVIKYNNFYEPQELFFLIKKHNYKSFIIILIANINFASFIELGIIGFFISIVLSYYMDKMFNYFIGIYKSKYVLHANKNSLSLFNINKSIIYNKPWIAINKIEFNQYPRGLNFITNEAKETDFNWLGIKTKYDNLYISNNCFTRVKSSYAYQQLNNLIHHKIK